MSHITTRTGRLLVAALAVSAIAVPVAAARPDAPSGSPPRAVVSQDLRTPDAADAALPRTTAMPRGGELHSSGRASATTAQAGLGRDGGTDTTSSVLLGVGALVLAAALGAVGVRAVTRRRRVPVA